MSKNWDSPIDEDGVSGGMLPAGEYLFVVKSMTKGVSKGEKTAGSPQAKLVLQIYAKEDTAFEKQIGIAFSSLTLHDGEATWGIVCQFFVCIGERKHGETINQCWDMVPGASGRCVLELHTYNGKESMQVKQYLDPVATETKEPTEPKPDDDNIPF